MVHTGVMARSAPKQHRLASRITDECRALLNALMARYGISEAAVIEQAVREYAERRSITARPGAVNESRATGAEGYDAQQPPPSRQRDVPRTGDSSD